MPGMATSPQGFNHEVISLPPEAISTNQNDFALDIGGSLAKIAYYCTIRRNGSGLEHELHLVSFSLTNLDESLHFIRQHIMGTENHTRVRGTGVGCTKYRNKIETILHVRLESDSLEAQHAAEGLDFLWRHLPLSQLLHDHTSMGLTKVNQRCPLSQSGILPCLVINIGSAVTMLKVDENGPSPTLAGGSAQGGLTFMGLGFLLTGAKTFSELIELAEKGDHKKLDLSLRDTCGEGYNHLGSDAMVSHFGKVAMALATKQGLEFKKEDIAASLLVTIIHELAQTTYLIAKSNAIHNLCFIGSFIHGNRTIINLIRNKLLNCTQFLQYDVKPFFPQHESYPGVIGVLVDKHEPKANGDL